MITTTTFICPAQGCGYKTRLRADGTIGAHYTGTGRCAAYRKTPEEAANLSTIGCPRRDYGWGTRS